MNKIDDILERLKDQQPVIDDPDALTERIMNSLPDISEGTGQGKARLTRIRWWMATAACLIFMIGIGTMLLFNVSPSRPQQAQISQSDVRIVGTVNTKHLYKEYKASVQSVQSICTGSTKHRNKAGTADIPSAPVLPVPDSHHPVVANDPNLHYAVHDLEKDTLPYQDPARVDEFIAKLAEFNNVKQGGLQCSQPLDSNVVSTVYVFPDQKEIDVFSRLLQVACWYDSKTSGYHLNFSHRQFFFELKDMRKQLQYRWIAERVNGKILLYSTCAPIEVVVSSACYQEYLDELMHTKSLNSKTLDI